MRSMYLGYVVLLVVLTLGCRRTPDYPPPEGFVEQCYGGDFEKYLNGTSPDRMWNVHVGEADWSAVMRTMRALGEELKLEVFDASVRDPVVNTFGVALCSDKGMWVWADQRIWKGGPVDDFMSVSVHHYKPTYEWQSVAAAVERELSESWKVEQVR